MISTSETPSIKIKAMPIGESLVFFGIPTLLLYFATHIFIKILQSKFYLPLEVCWFISGGLLVFFPLFIVSLLAYYLEGNELTFNAFKKRFRLNPMAPDDWLWALAAVTFIVVTTILVIFTAKYFIPSFSPSPPFLQARALPTDEIWVLWAWVPFFFFNIIGEEFLWRGYILPRQELAHGKYAWFVNGVLWMMFHFSLGKNLILTLIPIIFISSFVVQKQKNTWIGILIHGLVNGGGFLSISLSLI